MRRTPLNVRQAMMLTILSIVIVLSCDRGGSTTTRSLAELDSVVRTLEKDRGNWVLYRQRVNSGPFGPPAPLEPLDAFPLRDACLAEAAKRVNRAPVPQGTPGAEEFSALEYQGGSYSVFNLRCLPRVTQP